MTIARSFTATPLVFTEYWRFCSRPKCEIPSLRGYVDKRSVPHILVVGLCTIVLPSAATSSTRTFPGTFHRRTPRHARSLSSAPARQVVDHGLNPDDAFEHHDPTRSGLVTETIFRRNLADAFRMPFTQDQVDALVERYRMLKTKVNVACLPQFEWPGRLFPWRFAKRKPPRRVPKTTDVLPAAPSNLGSGAGCLNRSASDSCAITSGPLPVMADLRDPLPAYHVFHLRTEVVGFPTRKMRNAGSSTTHLSRQVVIMILNRRFGRGGQRDS